MKEELGLTQKDLEDLSSSLPQQRISLILQGRADLQPYQAEALAQRFPPYRADWLLGHDNYPTTADYELAQERKRDEAADTDSMDVHSILMRLALRSGYLFAVATTKMGDVDEDLDYKDGTTSFILSKRGERGSKHLSTEELKEIEAQIINFTEFQLWKAMQTLTPEEEEAQNKPSITEYLTEDEKRDLIALFRGTKGADNGKG
ncbi:hypothetical protein VIN30_06115 [Adlercreutzia sp. R7]|uniref:XRE family transcriptional regulator n=1 Tax=Adlercreutzia wanghongyangiae TaxID=3111451 RepID=A0ABU6IHU3_9ACTN|nr:hypothetical protein [Adlercreutzia sp. R7]